MPVGMKPICLNDAPSTTCTPSASMSATKKVLPSGEMRMSCGMPREAQMAPPTSGESITVTGFLFFSKEASWATTSGRS